MSRPAVAYINLDHLCHNYHLLRERAAGARLMAVVKANAYGHGLDIVAPALFAQGCREFAVTDATEGAALRSLIGPDAEITLLSGIFDEDDAALAASHRLTPVIAEPRQIEQLRGARFSGGIWLKMDTGMGRLGAEEIPALAAESRKNGLHVIGVMSHLACADTPGHPLNSVQTERINALAEKMSSDISFSLLNSAGIATMPEYSLDVVRPGIALYGAEPAPTAPLGLKPVMQLMGGVIQVRLIAKGDSISYGATFTAEEKMRIAIISLGYADGLHRLLSNRGHAIYQGMRLPIVGRICMDYCILSIGDAPLALGDAVTFWGEEPLATDVAEEAGTIAYELFTGVGARVQRRPIKR